MEIHWGYRHPYIYTVLIWIAAILSFVLSHIACFFLIIIAAPCSFILERLDGFESPRELTRNLWKGVREIADR